MARLFRPPDRFGKAPAKLAPVGKRALPFYLTAEWKALVTRLIKLRGRSCQDCGAKGGRIYADHVVELKDGGAALDPMNVRLLCAPCHGRKTEQKKRERVGLHR